jgi:hypothetical protein
MFYLFQLFHSFLPLHNPIGFGGADFIELAFCLIIVAGILIAPRASRYVPRFSARTDYCVLALALLPIALRLALLPNHPAPTPDVYDEFGHLLVADTLLHFRFANPPLPLPQFFETFFVLQQPTYASIYPIGQGLMLAIGQALFGSPWAGVLISTGAFCALCYWMLRAFTTPAWALFGGLLAVIEFGPLCGWMNSYWGGHMAAVAGCLVFGALPRLIERARMRDAALLGLGLFLHLLTRPYESIFLLLSAMLFFLPSVRRAIAEFRSAPPPAPAPPSFKAYLGPYLAPASIPLLFLLAALGVTALQNKSVTGNWTMPPYRLSQIQYGVPAALTFLSDPFPQRQLTPQQALEYKSQLAFRSDSRENLATFLLRLEYRVRYYRFFFLPPLYLALPLLFFPLREFRLRWLFLTLGLFAAGVNFFPAFQLHYLAAVTCLFVLWSVLALERLSQWSPAAARFLMLFCAAHFLFWYTVHVFDNEPFSNTLRADETWHSINHANPERRIQVNRDLQSHPGKLLVFVRYTPEHIFQDEWVYNEADLNAARVVWARDLGPLENQKLTALYPDRTLLLLEPDARPPLLSPMRQLGAVSISR